MTVVAHGIYTYSDSFAPFVYDIVAHLKRYDPVIFTYGLGVHEVYTRFPVYAPNARNVFGVSLARQVWVFYQSVGNLGCL
jgi:acetate kinase